MGKGPNDDERRAENWLRQRGHRDLQWLSDDPPDLLVDGHCAVEVTRLSQRLQIGDDKKSEESEENVRIPLTDGLENAVCRLGPPGNKGSSWIIDCEYNSSDPRPRPKTVAAQVLEALAPLSRPYDDSTVSAMHRRYMNYDRHSGEPSLLGFPHLCLEGGICLDLEEFSYDPATFFVQNVSDGKGISIATELASGIRNRIAKKSDTVRKRKRVGNYKNWWLILIDHICHMPIQTLSSREQACVRDQNFEFWSRVTIVSSGSARWHCELLATEPERVNSPHWQ